MNFTETGIHPQLLNTLEQLRDRCNEDNRCVGMYFWGSLSTDTADSHSDIDVCAVVKKECYADFKRDVPAICESIFGEPVAWMPEGERPEKVNYAFLFRFNDEILLYDFRVISESFLKNLPPVSQESILFDKSGQLKAAVAPREIKQLNAGDLGEALQNYWIYMYLNGKYFERSDLYKILYVQASLFQRHMQIIRFRYPDIAWYGWYAKDTHLCPAIHRDQLLLYYRGARMDNVAAILGEEMDLFSEEAQIVCQEWKVDYPHHTERGVRQHLGKITGMNFES